MQRDGFVRSDLEPSIAAYPILKADLRKLGVRREEDRVIDAPRRIVDDNVGLADACLLDELPQQRQRQLRRIVQPLGRIGLTLGAVHVELDGHLFAGLVSDVAPPALAIRMSEQRRPSVRIGLHTGQRPQGPAEHLVGQHRIGGLVLEPPPTRSIAVPARDSGVVDPDHAAGKDALGLADRLIGRLAGNPSGRSRGFGAEQLGGAQRTGRREHRSHTRGRGLTKKRST